MTMDTMFEAAVTSTGPAYLDAEQRLRDAEAAAVPVLEKNLHRSDPIARLVARVILDWLQGSATNFQDALDYLDYLPERIAHTPMGDPRPDGVAGYLSDTFEARVVELLALRLVKGIDWPQWRVYGVLFYLKEQARPSTTEALLRFTVETQNDDARSDALDAIRASHDRGLKSKIAAERIRALALKLPFPPSLADLDAQTP
jgi:hypothetical protein